MSFRPLVFIKTLLALIRDKINPSDNIWILKDFFQISIMHCTVDIVFVEFYAMILIK